MRPLTIRRGFALDKNGSMDFSAIESVFREEISEKQDTSVLEDCFLSTDGQKAWARFNIEWSAVTHINILNVPKGNSEFFCFVRCHYKLKQAENGIGQRHIQSTKIAKGLPSVKYSLLQHSKIENQKVDLATALICNTSSKGMPRHEHRRWALMQRWCVDVSRVYVIRL